MAGLLDGKVALVTGAGGGIGRATALAMAAEGARVAVSDIAPDRAAETLALMEAAGGHGLATATDVRDAGQVDKLIADVVAHFGRLDCACNNAGIAAAQAGSPGKRTAEWSEEAFDRIMAVNLKGVWLCMRAELNQMVAQKSGSIINIASIAGLTGLQMSSAYVASKHGVVGYTRTAAIEYATDNIRVNAVAPGFIETDMTKEVMSRRGHEIVALIPQRRLGQAEDIAQMVCWLASDRASYVTGATYNVDGGYMAV